jgi:hypothetical protein
VRHGIAQLDQGVEDAVPPPITLADEARRARDLGYRFYIASVDANGVPLNLEETYFLPSTLSDGIIVGPRLLAGLRNCCNLDGGYVIPLDSRSIQAHEWTYSLPNSPDDDRFYIL